MTIQLNGKSHSLDAQLSVLQLLSEIKLEGKPVIVEINQEAIFPRNYACVMIQEGDAIELVMLAAGG